MGKNAMGNASPPRKRSQKRASTNLGNKKKKVPATKKSLAKKQVASKNMPKTTAVKKPETMKKKASEQAGIKDDVKKEPKSGKSGQGKLNDNLAEASEKVSIIGKNLTKVSEKFNPQEMNSREN